MEMVSTVNMGPHTESYIRVKTVEWTWATAGKWVASCSSITKILIKEWYMMENIWEIYALEQDTHVSHTQL